MNVLIKRPRLTCFFIRLPEESVAEFVKLCENIIVQLLIVEFFVHFRHSIAHQEYG